jgi:transposase
MTEKDTYRPDELATALGVSIWTIYRRLKKDRIRHTHLDEYTHRNARIPKAEFERLVKG